MMAHSRAAFFMLVRSHSGSDSAILGFASALGLTLSHSWLGVSPLWLTLDPAPVGHADLLQRDLG